MIVSICSFVSFFSSKSLIERWERMVSTTGFMTYSSFIMYVYEKIAPFSRRKWGGCGSCHHFTSKGIPQAISAPWLSCTPPGETSPRCGGGIGGPAPPSFF
jgi:hypothetical protein